MTDWFHKLDASSKVMILGMLSLMVIVTVVMIVAAALGDLPSELSFPSAHHSASDADRTLPIVVGEGDETHDAHD